MKCRIKNIAIDDCYYHSYVGDGTWHFTYKDNAKIFDSVEEARKIIKKYRFNERIIIIEKIYKGGK